MLFFTSEETGGDEKQTLESIYRRYGKKMFTAAYRISGSVQDAEDAVQTAFIKISKSLKRLNVDDEDAMRGYVLTVAKNEAYNIIRSRKNEISVDELQDISDGDEGFEIKVAEGAEFKTAISIMRQMDDKYRAPLYLHYVMGYSLRDTAKQLDRKEKTVRVQIERGLQILKKRMKEAGYES